MSDLQELRRLIDEETFPYELNPDWEVVTNIKVVEAARRVANLDKEKVYRYTTAVALLMGLENVLSATMMETLADAAIDAALGIMEDE